MSSSLPPFQLASELSPSPSRDKELESIICRQAEQLERLQDSREVVQKPQAGLKAEEIQRLTEVLGGLNDRIKELEEITRRQTVQIDDLRNINDRMHEAITDVKDLAQDRIGELIKEIVDIRDARKHDNERVNDHADWLEDLDTKVNEHANAINKVWQVTKKTHNPPTGKKSKARMEKLKEILRGGPKTYKELERLLGISPKEMNRLVSRLDSRSYEIFFRAGDNRQKVLRLRSLTSNVKDSGEEGNRRG